MGLDFTVFPLSLPVALSAPLVGFATFTFFFFFPHCQLETPRAGSKQCPSYAPGAGAGKQYFHTWDKTFDQITCPSCSKCLTPGRLLPCLILSEMPHLQKERLGQLRGQVNVSGEFNRQ